MCQALKSTQSTFKQKSVKSEKCTQSLILDSWDEFLSFASELDVHFIILFSADLACWISLTS